MKKFTYIPPEFHDTLAPLFFNNGDEPYPAFLQLDCRTGEVTYGVRWEPGASEEEAAGHVRRWPVPANLLGRRLKAIAKELEADLQSVLDGYSEVYKEYEYSNDTRGELDEEARTTEEDIRLKSSKLFENAYFSFDLAPIWTAEELAEWAADEIAPSLTDDEIARLALDCKLGVADEVVVLGDESQAFRDLRDSLQ